MSLSDEQLDKYRALHREHFGLEITREEAEREGRRLIELIRLIHPDARRPRPESMRNN